MHCRPWIGAVCRTQHSISLKPPVQFNETRGKLFPVITDHPPQYHSTWLTAAPSQHIQADPRELKQATSTELSLPARFSSTGEKEGGGQKFQRQIPGP